MTAEAVLTGRALQDVLKVHCFGCGALNEHGLQIKSRWEDEELACRWRPKPYHIGHPGIVYGGTIASLADCHSIWAALATACRERGHDLERDGPPPFVYVTGHLSVKFLKPVSVNDDLELRARVVESSERRSFVHCRVLQGGIDHAAAEVIAVQMKKEV